MIPTQLTDPVSLYTAEALMVHALCDRQLVPRIIDGTTLSMAQRVNVMEQVCASLIERVGMDPPSIIH